jgi:hypothetical protein
VIDEVLTYEEAYEPGARTCSGGCPTPRASTELTGWRPTPSLDDIIRDVVAEERQRLRAPAPPRA